MAPPLPPHFLQPVSSTNCPVTCLILPNTNVSDSTSSSKGTSDCKIEDVTEKNDQGGFDELSSATTRTLSRASFNDAQETQSHLKSYEQISDGMAVDYSRDSSVVTVSSELPRDDSDSRKRFYYDHRTTDDPLKCTDMSCLPSRELQNNTQFVHYSSDAIDIVPIDLQNREVVSQSYIVTESGSPSDMRHSNSSSNESKHSGSDFARGKLNSNFRSSSEATDLTTDTLSSQSVNYPQNYLSADYNNVKELSVTTYILQKDVHCADSASLASPSTYFKNETDVCPYETFSQQHRPDVSSEKKMEYSVDNSPSTSIDSEAGRRDNLIITDSPPSSMAKHSSLYLHQYSGVPFQDSGCDRGTVATLPVELSSSLHTRTVTGTHKVQPDAFTLQAVYDNSDTNANSSHMHSHLSTLSMTASETHKQSIIDNLSSIKDGYNSRESEVFKDTNHLPPFSTSGLSVQTYLISHESSQLVPENLSLTESITGGTDVSQHADKTVTMETGIDYRSTDSLMLHSGHESARPNLANYSGAIHVAHSPYSVSQLPSIEPSPMPSPLPPPVFNTTKTRSSGSPLPPLSSQAHDAVLPVHFRYSVHQEHFNPSHVDTSLTNEGIHTSHAMPSSTPITSPNSCVQPSRSNETLIPSVSTQYLNSQSLLVSSRSQEISADHSFYPSQSQSPLTLSHQFPAINFRPTPQVLVSTRQALSANSIPTDSTQMSVARNASSISEPYNYRPVLSGRSVALCEHDSTMHRMQLDGRNRVPDQFLVLRDDGVERTSSVGRSEILHNNIASDVRSSQYHSVLLHKSTNKVGSTSNLDDKFVQTGHIKFEPDVLKNTADGTSFTADHYKYYPDIPKCNGNDSNNKCYSASVKFYPNPVRYTAVSPYLDNGYRSEANSSLHLSQQQQHLVSSSQSSSVISQSSMPIDTSLSQYYTTYSPHHSSNSAVVASQYSANYTSNIDTACLNRDQLTGSEKLDKIYQDVKPFDQGYPIQLCSSANNDDNETIRASIQQHHATSSTVTKPPRSKKPKEPKPPRVPVVHKCKECDRIFKNSTQLKNHMWRHTGEKPFTCDECGSKFTQQGNLRAHRRIHTGERPYECPICKHCFTQLSTLKTHQKIHSDERPHKCNLCDAAFRQVANLKTHQVTHTGERPHKCELCDKAFTQKSNLKAHRNRVHNPDGSFSAGNRRGRKKNPSAIKPYSCYECGAKFTMNSNLKIHMKLHSGLRNFSCNICSAAFSHRTNLKSHMQRMHSSLASGKKIKCDECPASFRLKRCLKIHKRKKHPIKSLRIKILGGESKYFMRERGTGSGTSEDFGDIEGEVEVEEADEDDIEEDKFEGEHELNGSASKNDNPVVPVRSPKEEPLDSTAASEGENLTSAPSCADDGSVDYFRCVPGDDENEQSNTRFSLRLQSKVNSTQSMTKFSDMKIVKEENCNEECTETFQKESNSALNSLAKLDIVTKDSDALRGDVHEAKNGSKNSSIGSIGSSNAIAGSNIAVLDSSSRNPSDCNKILLPILSSKICEISTVDSTNCNVSQDCCHEKKALSKISLINKIKPYSFDVGICKNANKFLPENNLDTDSDKITLYDRNCFHSSTSSHIKSSILQGSDTSQIVANNHISEVDSAIQLAEHIVNHLGSTFRPVEYSNKSDDDESAKEICVERKKLQGISENARDNHDLIDVVINEFPTTDSNWVSDTPSNGYNNSRCKDMSYITTNKDPIEKVTETLNAHLQKLSEEIEQNKCNQHSSGVLPAASYSPTREDDSCGELVSSRVVRPSGTVSGCSINAHGEHKNDFGDNIHEQEIHDMSFLKHRYDASHSVLQAELENHHHELHYSNVRETSE